MSIVKILIAEDNVAHASKMEILLDKLDYELLGIQSNEKDFLQMFKATSPDLVILDIELEKDGDGIEIAAKINRIKPTPVIFATSFEDKVTIKRALQEDPYAYLTKPIERTQLQAAIELALYKFSRIGQGHDKKDYKGWEEDAIVNDSFFIKSGSKLVKVRHDDVLWIEVAQERYCDIVTPERNYQLRSSVNQLEERLHSSRFVRVHRSHIVNIQKVDGIDEFEMTVKVGSRSLPLGGVYKANVLNRLKLL
ncbi:MAG: response regulator transcription factor [Cyclobacteriaceae bacterium]